MGDSAGAPALADSDEEPFLDAAWTEAIEATELLRTVLADLGLADCFPRLRGDVNVYGRPMVTVGRIEPGAARRLAAVLSRVAQEVVHPVREQRGAPTRLGAVPAFGTPVFGAAERAVPPQTAASQTEDLPPPLMMPPAPRTYCGPGSTSPVDDLQASALRLMRLVSGPAVPAVPASTAAQAPTPDPTAAAASAAPAGPRGYGAPATAAPVAADAAPAVPAVAAPAAASATGSSSSTTPTGSAGLSGSIMPTASTGLSGSTTPTGSAGPPNPTRPPTAPALPSPPASAPSPVREQRGLPLRADVAELDQVRGDTERLPA